MIQIEVFSDFVCPWCPIGESRLAKALALVGPGFEAKVTFRPFELNPDMPREGVDRKKHLAAKFGSLENYARLSQTVTAAASSEGLTFNFDKIEKSCNTRDAHRLSWLAAELGKQGPLVDSLFHAYFTKGENLGDHDVLRRAATEAGLDKARVEALLASDEGLAEVLEQERRAQRIGIDGVPCFVIDGRPMISGAQQPQVIAAALRELAAAAK